MMADLRYEEWPGEDYPRVVSIKTRGTATNHPAVALVAPRPPRGAHARAESG
jgi:hypothetical protein